VFGLETVERGYLKGVRSFYGLDVSCVFFLSLDVLFPLLGRKLRHRRLKKKRKLSPKRVIDERIPM
jgi:hypothetical protein